MEIAQALLSDVEEIVRLQEKVITENQYFISTVKEFSPATEKDHLSTIIAQNKAHAIVFIAKVNNIIVGVIIFRASTLSRLAHHGTFSIYIDANHRQKGIGTQLLQALIQWAENHPTIEKICLGVFSNNLSAIQLYKKMGFVEEGRKIKDIKLSESEYVDDVLMYKLL